MKTFLITITSIIFSVSAGTASAHGDIGSVGAGVGASYGFVGASFDKSFTKNLYGSVGLGSAGDDLGYNVGLRYYLQEAEKTWRPRLVLNYGTNGVISTQTCFFSSCSEEEYESFEGWSIGVGQSVGFGSNQKHGFEFDLLFIADDGGLADRVDELEDEGFDADDGFGKVYFSIGYRFSF
ncbi:MAG: hypothetical protein K6L81_00350 [Agarilytica sp.]